jgi:hypothetical protein
MRACLKVANVARDLDLGVARFDRVSVDRNFLSVLIEQKDYLRAAVSAVSLIAHRSLLGNQKCNRDQGISAREGERILAALRNICRDAICHCVRRIQWHCASMAHSRNELASSPGCIRSSSLTVQYGLRVAGNAFDFNSPAVRSSGAHFAKTAIVFASAICNMLERLFVAIALDFDFTHAFTYSFERVFRKRLDRAIAAIEALLAKRTRGSREFSHRLYFLQISIQSL